MVEFDSEFQTVPTDELGQIEGGFFYDFVMKAMPAEVKLLNLIEKEIKPPAPK